MILGICNRRGAPPMRHREGVGRVKIHKVRGINLLIKNILRFFFFFFFFFFVCLFSFLVPYWKLSSNWPMWPIFLSNIGGMFRSRSFCTVITVSLSSASEHANNNKIVLKVLTFYAYYQNKIFKEYDWHFLSTKCYLMIELFPLYCLGNV